jgi:hypothetical protein
MAYTYDRRLKVAERIFRYLAKCKKCGTITSGKSSGSNMNMGKVPKGPYPRTGDVYSDSWGNQVMDCRKCGEPARAKQVRGKYNPDIPCNAKCLASTGFNCECSCGGKNHGASYSPA